jgi:ATP-binding cassette subfamily C (CFTR/MRP) protein 1
MSALLRLINPQSGSVCIGDVDMSAISADAVRQSITVIPQSPFFLPGSVSLNLTLLRDDIKSSEAACIGTLKKVGLWDIISAKGGLGMEMSTLSLSHGQQQLFCLARAILKKTLPRLGRILILDEATSGVDQEMEALMECLLADEFQEYTVICIAHRLRMAKGCDALVVLDGGRIVEVGEFGKLLEEKGAFWELWEAQK